MIPARSALVRQQLLRRLWDRGGLLPCGRGQLSPGGDEAGFSEAAVNSQER